MTTAIVEGTTVRKGDTVGFKFDTEQEGVIGAIDGTLLQLYNPDGFDGILEGNTYTTVDTSRCWVISTIPEPIDLEIREDAGEEWLVVAPSGLSLTLKSAQEAETLQRHWRILHGLNPETGQSS